MFTKKNRDQKGMNVENLVGFYFFYSKLCHKFYQTRTNVNTELILTLLDKNLYNNIVYVSNSINTIFEIVYCY